MKPHNHYMNDTFIHHASRDDSKFIIGGVFLGGIATMVTSNLLIGGACVMGGYGMAFNQIYQDSKRNRLILESGVVAPFLKGDEYQKYIDTFGSEEADRQSIYAIRQGTRPYGDPMDGLEERHPDIEDKLEKLSTVKPGKTFFMPSAIAPVNGSNLSAIQMLTPVAAPALAPAPKDEIAFLASLTTAPLQPVIIAGLPGSGKGFMASIALSLGYKENGLRFWVFNPKNKLAEAGYWARAERHYLKDRLTTDPTLFRDMMAVLEEFSAEGSRRNNAPGDYQPFVLMLEEITALIGLFTPKQKQIFKSKLTAIAALLRGSNMAIWLSGQSVTLEDLGFTGRSNRAMFTSIVAVGEDRTGSKTVCDLLSVPFDEATLLPGRCWITNNAAYKALTPQAIVPTYPTWESVPNVIDLRPTVEETEVDYSEATQVYPVEYQQSPKQKLEQSLRLNIAEPTVISEVEAIPFGIVERIADPIDSLLMQYADDPKTASFLKWVSDKPDGEIFTRRDVQGSYWAKKNGREKEAIDVALLEAMNSFLLIEIDAETYQKKDIEDKKDMRRS